MIISKVKQAYRKERKRVQQLFRRWQKRGYVFPDGTVPDIPKKITAGSVRRLAKITSDVLSNKAIGWAEPRTGEVLTVQQGRARERQETARRLSEARQRNIWLSKQENLANMPDEVDVIIDNIYDYINKDFGVPWQHERQHVLTDLLNAIVIRDGREAVARRVADNIERLDDAIDRAILSSDQDKALAAINEFTEILNGGALSHKQQESLEAVFAPTEEDEIVE